MVTMSTVYPSIDEILPVQLRARVPASLAETIKDRYEVYGGKYLTSETTEDGRVINACMRKSSIQDALEEVVDAVFNVLVWLLKLSLAGRDVSSAYSALLGLIELYALLETERHSDGAL